MFSLSAKAIYGLMAMLELALNDHKELIQIKNIADSCSIPQNFLEQLLIAIRAPQLQGTFLLAVL